MEEPKTNKEWILLWESIYKHPISYKNIRVNSSIDLGHNWHFYVNNAIFKKCTKCDFCVTFLLTDINGNININGDLLIWIPIYDSLCKGEYIPFCSEVIMHYALC